MKRTLPDVRENVKKIKLTHQELFGYELFDGYEHFESVHYDTILPSQMCVCILNRPDMKIYHDENNHHYIRATLESMDSCPVEPLDIRSVELSFTLEIQPIMIHKALSFIRKITLLETLIIVFEPSHGQLPGLLAREGQGHIFAEYGFRLQVRTVFGLISTFLKSILNMGLLKSLSFTTFPCRSRQRESTITTEIFFETMHYLPSLLVQNKKLTHLSLYNLNATASRLGCFFEPIIGKTSHLEHLVIQGFGICSPNICANHNSTICGDYEDKWWQFIEGCDYLKYLELHGGFDMKNTYKLVSSTQHYRNLVTLIFYCEVWRRMSSMDLTILTRTYSLLENHPAANTLLPIFHQNASYAFTSEFFDIVHKEIISFFARTTLTKICISTLYLKQSLAKELFSILKNNLVLETLHLNEIVGLDVSWIIDLLGKNSIRDLKLNHCGLQDDGLLNITTAVTKNTSLTSLDLCDNHFDGTTTMKSLCTILVGNSSLNHLKFFDKQCVEFMVEYRGYLEGPDTFNSTKWNLPLTVIQSLKKNCTLWDYSSILFGGMFN